MAQNAGVSCFCGIISLDIMMDRYYFREARLSDLPVIGGIFRDAVARMLAEGKQQWDENYPTEYDVLADLAGHTGYVMELNGRVVAYGAVSFDGETAYDGLQGEWSSDGPYVVVHRLAVARDAQCSGIARRFFDAAERLAAEQGIGSFRVDTNFDNDRMLRLLNNLGFVYCGEITYPQGTRMAFEKLI